MAEPKKAPDKEKPQNGNFLGAWATEEDLEQLNELRNRENQTIFEFSNAPEDQLPELQKRIRQLQAESARLYRKIFTNFILSYSENQGAIMEHFLMALQSDLHSKETYEKHVIRQAKRISEIMNAAKDSVLDPEADAEKIKEMEAAGLFEVEKETANFSNYYIYLLSSLFDFLQVLIYYGLDTSGFFDAIRDKAAEAYPNDDHSIIVHHPGRESQQEFTEPEYRAFRENLYRNSRTAILKRPAGAGSTSIPDFDLQLFAEGEPDAEIIEENQEFLKHVFRKTEQLDYPLDKPNSVIWTLLEKDMGGQLSIKAEKSGSRKDISIYYSIDFESFGKGLSVSKVLTAFDKRVYIAAAGLFNAGNNVITTTQIHYAMGGTSKPKSEQLKKINDSLTKMANANIYLDNVEEVNEKYNYPHFRYDGKLLPMERITASINGRVTDTAVHLFREPPLVSFARERKQVTTVPIKLLAAPVNKTESAYRIEDYLIERISHMKTGKAKTRILYKTLFEHCGIFQEKQQERTRKDKLPRFLNYYKEQGFISGFSSDAKGITIKLSENQSEQETAQSEN